MKRLALAVMLIAAPAMADEVPDYSRDRLLSLFALRVEERHKLPPPRVQWHLGFVEFHALGMDWRVIYMPLLAPFAGTRMNETATLPDPFALTNTQLAGSRPFTPEPSFAVKREIGRALAMERRKR